MKRIAIVPLMIVLTLIAACGDQDASKADLDEPKVSGKIIPDDYESRSPDKLNVYQNVDKHPTLVRICIDGVAFLTISTTHSQGGFNEAVRRVEEWDEYCVS